MKAFNAASVKQFSGANNNSMFILLSDDGEELELNISPSALKQILTSLMTRPKSPNLSLALPCNGIRNFVLEKSTPGLEISFGKDLAIPIVFPHTNIADLKAVVDDLEKRLARNQSEKH